MKTIRNVLCFSLLETNSKYKYCKKNTFDNKNRLCSAALLIEQNNLISDILSGLDPEENSYRAEISRAILADC